MKILFLTPQLPYPPEKGTALRNWGLINGLAARHEIALLSFLDPEQRPQIAPALQAVCRVEVVAAPVRRRVERLRGLLTTHQPDMALRLASEQFGQRLGAWLARERFDVVQVEGIELAPYIEVIEQARPRPLVVFDDHNCEYLLQKRACLADLRAPRRWTAAAYSAVQWRRLRRFEAGVCRRADRVLAVSEADAAALRRLVPGLEVTVVPNGIDTRDYRPEPEREAPAPTLVFSGTMDFRPNVDAVLWFARQVLPRVEQAQPGVRLLVVGQRPHPRLDVLRDNPAIALTGWVADSRPYIRQAAVYIVPLRVGGGTRLKLLEAMALGKAIVSTRLGAEGYPVRDGRELLLADTPDEFAAATVRLLGAPERRAELGRAARAFVEARYDWRAIVPLAERAYRR
jgi:sugar transferase (PEP-CTERM/EpsH1 system associated)